MTSKLPRMRSAQKCWDMIHESDPDSRISLKVINRLAREGTIPSVITGGKQRLINYDALLDYLCNSTTPQEYEQPNITNGIRAIPER